MGLFGGENWVGEGGGGGGGMSHLQCLISLLQLSTSLAIWPYCVTGE